jgi:hypothetical protein
MPNIIPKRLVYQAQRMVDDFIEEKLHEPARKT